MKRWFPLLIGLTLLVVLVLSGCGNAATTTTAPTTAPVTTSTAPLATSAAPRTTPPSNTTPPVTTAPATTSSAIKRGGVLNVQSAAGPVVFGIPTQLGLDSQSTGVALIMIESLISYDNAGVAHPVLAESWKIDPVAGTITFNIRKGVKFHDGTDCDASAVAWNLDQFIQTKNAAADAWLSVAVLDPYTVMLKLKEYKATAFAAFDSYAGLVVSPTAFKANGSEWAKTHPVGTGPYMLKTFVRDSYVEMVKNPNYWQPGKPYLDGIKYVVLGDTTAARMAFEAGQIDILQSQLPDTANALKAKGAKVESRPGTIGTLIPDSKNAASPFAKKAVREAVEYAIDRKAVASIGAGYWEASTQAAMPWQYGYIKDLVGRPYNPDKSKQLLKDAGYTTPLAISITTSAIYNADPAVAMMNYLNAAGFKCTLTTLTQAAWTQQSTTGWTNSLFYAPLATTDAEYAAFLDRYYAANSVRYPVLLKPAVVTDSINQLLFEQDYTKRVALAQKTVQAISDDCTTIPVYHGPSLCVQKTYVMDANFASLAGIGFRWDSVNVWMNK